MRKKLYFIICFMLFTASCEKEIPKQHKEVISGAIIFFDTSMSMKGYFRTSNNQATIIQKFLQREFRNILSENGLSPPYLLSYFGADIEGPKQIQGDIGNKFIFNSQEELEDVFSGTATNLIGVFGKKEFGKYSASIIITDGIQGFDGFDTGEMLRIIRVKIDEPLYLYLIGIKSEFRGNIYPGISGAGAFWYSGPRPIYIWIATQEKEVGYNLAKMMVNKLCFLAGSSSDTVKLAALTHLFPFDIKINPNIDSSFGYSQPIGKNIFKLRLKRTKSKKVNIPINLEITTRQTLSDVGWEINLKLKSKKSKNIGWANIVKNNGEWLLCLTYNLIPSKGEISIIAAAKANIKINPWWTQWSTEDDSLRKNADKTLYLERLSPFITQPLQPLLEAGSVSLEIKKP